MFDRRQFLKAAAISVFSIQPTTLLLDTLEGFCESGALQLPWSRRGFLFACFEGEPKIKLTYQRGLYWPRDDVSDAVHERWFSTQFQIGWAEWDCQLENERELARTKYWPMAETRFDEWEEAVLEELGYTA